MTSEGDKCLTFSSPDNYFKVSMG